MRVVARGQRWASLGQTVAVEVQERPGGDVVLRAPFYRRTIPVSDIAGVDVTPDDGPDQGLLNWFVVGRADTPDGVRLSSGGAARLDLMTKGGRRYVVVLDDLRQAERAANALRALTASPPAS